MSWFSFIVGLLSFLNSLISYAKRKHYFREGQEAAIAAALRKQADDLAKVQSARRKSDADFKRMPDNDDGFRRD